MGLYLGIDFGTSTTYVTRWNEEKREVEPVENLGKYGSGNVFPNVIFYDSATEQQIGYQAADRGSGDQLDYVSAIKRKLEERSFKRFLPNAGRELSAVEIARDSFACLKRKIEKNFGGERVDGVVISVPFAFQHAERGRIKHAAELAGLKVLRLIEEPVAAALSFGLVQKAKPGVCEKVIVFDLGGGTFDVAAFKFVKQAENRFAIDVLGTDGNKHLGGIDIDAHIADKIKEAMEEAHAEYRLDALEAKHLAQEKARMDKLARETKEIIACEGDERVSYTSIVDDSIEYDETWDEEDLDQMLEHCGFMDEVRDVLDNLLFELEMNKEDVDRVIMVGGTTQIPSIQNVAKEYFGKAPEIVEHPDEMVGTGAGIYCGILLDKRIKFSITLRLSKAVGIKKGGRFTVLLPRNERYGKQSDVVTIQTARKAHEKKITIYQGDGAHQTELAVLTVPQETIERLHGSLGLSLGTDQNGMVGYVLYDIAPDGGRRAVAQGMLEVS
ncbi:MAG: Hsp70 family protein [Selenomonas sp.]|uniref:Hsp70 family protein n=1 Tax=Selenomonas sp. TaxID=2053611 RepID=UPI0025E81414|nr:Hsp70 family protein [Selenomonas sp.]MCI6085683.1 Hsp70 family protein [Selenomonas sp.]MDY4416784.1 Hsp70 family protein [Selenomonas sp.]